MAFLQENGHFIFLILAVITTVAALVADKKATKESHIAYRIFMVGVVTCLLWMLTYFILLHANPANIHYVKYKWPDDECVLLALNKVTEEWVCLTDKGFIP